MNETTLPSRLDDILLQNWDIYRYFLAIARGGSLSDAAKRLQESQPTVGRKLNELETQLGVQLVERTNAGTMLTSAGALVLEHVEKIAQEAVGMAEALREDGKKMAGKVVITAPEGLGVTVLARHLQKFRALYPEIDLDLRIGTGKLDLLKRDADIAIRLGKPMQPSLLGRRIDTVTFGLYASERYLRHNPAPKSVRSLRDHLFVGLSIDGGRLPQELELAKLVPNPRHVLCTDNMQVQHKAVVDGIGIGALPGYMATASDRLVHILPQKFAPKAELWILMRGELKDVARVRAAASFFTEIAANSARGGF